MMQPIAELRELDQILKDLNGEANVRVLCHVDCGRHRFPVHAITFGPSHDRQSPALCLVGGVHGLERIGTQVLLAHLRGLVAHLRWDRQLRMMLQEVRVIFIPLLNPSGVYLHQRSNHHGVDLMRNAPVEASEVAPSYFLFRGHRLTSRLPWYRGQSGQPMEAEAQALCDFVESELFPASLAISLDVHSGFAGHDRIWFPYAGSRDLFPSIAELMALRKLLNESVPYHRYLVEPQALHYTAHGDLWDYLYLRHRERSDNPFFLPLTLELASAAWLRKNPRQALSRLGLFHPVEPRRVRRILRRHDPLLQFLLRAVYAKHAWSQLNDLERHRFHVEALRLWGQAGILPINRVPPSIRHS